VYCLNVIFRRGENLTHVLFDKRVVCAVFVEQAGVVPIVVQALFIDHDETCYSNQIPTIVIVEKLTGRYSDSNCAYYN